MSETCFAMSLPEYFHIDLSKRRYNENSIRNSILAMLNKKMLRPFLIFSQLDYLIQIVDIQSHS